MSERTLAPGDLRFLDLADAWRALAWEATDPPETGEAERNLSRFRTLSYRLMLQARERRPERDASALASLSMLDHRRLPNPGTALVWMTAAADLVELMVCEVVGYKTEPSAPDPASPPSPDLLSVDLSPAISSSSPALEAATLIWAAVHERRGSAMEAAFAYNHAARQPGRGWTVYDDVDGNPNPKAMQKAIKRYAPDRLKSFPKGGNWQSDT